MIKEKGVGLRYIITVGLIVLLLLWLAARAFGQTDATKQNQSTNSSIQELEAPSKLRPVFSDYKGVTIGTHADDVLALLNRKPRFVDSDGYFFVFPRGESVQFILDDDRKVNLISVTYSGKDSHPPSYERVFGPDLPIRTTAAGTVYKIVNYPEAGFSVSYYSSSGDNPTTTITVQELFDAPGPTSVRAPVTLS